MPRRPVDFAWVWRKFLVFGPLAWAVILVPHTVLGGDSWAYWLADQHPQHLYRLAPGYLGAYLYSPAFAQAVWPLALAPWRVFQVAWSALLLGVFAWLLAPMGRRGLPWLALCLVEVLLGNVYGLIAACAVLGIARWPGAWAFVLLTKVTPTVGIVWFAARREWRKLGILLAVSGVVVAVSAAIWPHAWVQWIHFLLDHRGARGSSFWPARLLAAVTLTYYAARSGRAWLVAPALVLAQPMMIEWWVGTPMLAAIPRLHLLSGPDVAPLTEHEGRSWPGAALLARAAAVRPLRAAAARPRSTGSVRT